MRSFDNRNHNFNLLVPRQYRGYFAKLYAYPDSDPIAMLRAPWETSLRCHGALGVPPATLRRVCYGDLFPRRPHCACFEHVQNLAATSATLGTSLRSAALPRRSVRSHNDPAAISGDLADFADRSEVAVLCDWGITGIYASLDLNELRLTSWYMQYFVADVLI